MLSPSSTTLSPSAIPFDVHRVDAHSHHDRTDVAAAEEPLELRLGGKPFVVIMRTPGDDEELAAGFLVAEQIVTDASDIAAMRWCRDAEGEEAPNTLSIWLQGDAAVRAQRAVSGRRHVTASSSCGVCGRRSIQDLLDGVRAVSGTGVVSRSTIESCPETLRAAQRTFAETGGLHAAGLFDPNGRLLRVAEDVGRHNAVDKVIGASLLAGELPLRDTVLFVSGRTSFEIVQKAVVAGIPIVASVSAPSSLAIELARESGLTLIGFVRGRSFNIYTHPDRVQL